MVVSDSVFIFKNGQAVDLHNLIGVGELSDLSNAAPQWVNYPLTHLLSSVQINVERRVDDSYSFEEMKKEREELVMAWSNYKTKNNR